jgi:hypothetical protein
MGWFGETLRFLDAYPLWARILLAGLAGAFLVVAIFARTAAPDPQGGAHPLEPSLTIAAVELFPDQDAAVKVTAFVNGAPFRYPSIGDVEWVQVAPDMSGQTFRLPRSDAYEVRFEMVKRGKDGRAEARLLSQHVLKFPGDPEAGVYRLHGFDPTSGTRSGTTDAELRYAFAKGR